MERTIVQCTNYLQAEFHAMVITVWNVWDRRKSNGTYPNDFGGCRSCLILYVGQAR